MSADDLRKMKERMNPKENSEVPADGGSVAGGALDGPFPENRDAELKQTGGVDSGMKTQPEKARVAEAMIARGKLYDVENTREQTTDKGTRHDMVVPGVLNIPPTIQAERIKMGQHPYTGEPWSPEERQQWEQRQEDDRIANAKAVRESELKMAQDQATPQRQPISHVPTAFLTQGQREAMAQSQNAGDSPARQAQVRDMMSPDAIGRRQGEQKMNEENDVEFDPELEKNAIEGNEEEGEDNEDADEVVEDLESKR